VRVLKFQLRDLNCLCHCAILFSMVDKISLLTTQKDYRYKPDQI